MRILVINGSPKGAKSNTMRVTNAFLEGLNKDRKHQVNIVETFNANVHPCRGCYCCWEKTPGKCVIRDDMDDIFQQYIDADIVIWSMPLFSFGMPSTIKAVLDRMLPLYLPTISERVNGGAAHPSRYDLERQSYFLICTCGFFSYENNTEALSKQFEIMYGSRLNQIICPEGDLFRISELGLRTRKYLAAARKAGTEFDKMGNISEESKENLKNKHYSPAAFVTMADANWKIRDDSLTEEEVKLIRCNNYLKQITAIYEPEYFRGEPVTLELFFTDMDRSYQLVFDAEKCTIIDDPEKFNPYSLKIISKLMVWINIAEGEVPIGKENTGIMATTVSKLQVLVDWMIQIQQKGKPKVLRM